MEPVLKKDMYVYKIIYLLIVPYLSWLLDLNKIRGETRIVKNPVSIRRISLDKNIPEK